MAVQDPTRARLERLQAQVPAAPAPAADVRAFAQRLSTWVLGGRGRSRKRAARAARLDLLAQRLEAEAPDAGLTRFFADLRRPGAFVRLLAETGIPAESSLWAEAARRLFARGLSIDVEDVDFAALCSLARLRAEDGELVDALSPQAGQTLAPVFTPSASEVRTAFELVLRRVTALGLSRGLLRLGTGATDRDSPFFELDRAARHWLEAQEVQAAREEADRAIQACEGEILAIHASMQRRGVSTALLFAVDQTEALLARLKILTRLLAGEPVGRDFLREVLRSAGEERSLSMLVRSKLARLARKVVEHSGHTGEHYVVRTAREYAALGASAAWGGAMAAMAALVKLALAATALAPGLLGLAYALNYAACFFVMQLCGFTLASRQPSMTAAALAKSLRVSDGLAEEVELVAGIARAQTIATVGNILVALPMAVLLDFGLRAVSGSSLLDAAEVAYVHQSITALHPSNVLFAALTGLFLWIASLTGGWAQNWSALHALPTAITESPPLQRAFGRLAAARLGRLAGRHFGGLCGYGTLAFLMGFTPLFASFMGLALQAPHVTIATASLGFAASAQWHGPGLDPEQLLWSGVGVLGIGLLNFGVSFALALALALRAMGVEGRQRTALLRGLFIAFVSHPLRFLLPVPASKPRAPG
jgi:site-specific recombinase